MSATGIGTPLMLRKWSATVSGLTKGSTADVHVDVGVSGWVPVLVADVSSSHAGSFCVTKQLITSDGKCFVTIFQPTNSWQSVTVSCTVLYVREGVVASRQYL